MSKTLEIAAESLYKALRKDMLPYTIWPDPKPRIIKKIIAALEEIRMSKDTESHTYPDGSKITITAQSIETLEHMAARLADLSNGDPVLETEILDALREVEARATERLKAYIDAPPAQMSWSKGLVNIDPTGMREVVDALAEAESELEEVKERRLETVGMCDQLMIELAQERAEVARLKEELKVI